MRSGEEYKTPWISGRFFSPEDRSSRTLGTIITTYRATPLQEGQRVVPFFFVILTITRVTMAQSVQELGYEPDGPDFES